MSFYILLNDTSKTPQEKLDIIGNCKCCEAHQINRPRYFAFWEESESGRHVNDKFPYGCECDCRHTARFICREFFNSHNNPEENSSMSTCSSCPMSPID